MAYNNSKKEAGERGKTAEKAVQKLLKRLGEEDSKFDWERNYDARSARGRFPARAGDFSIYSPGHHGLIEVKEVAHDFRLPQKNFSHKKFGKLTKRQLAGADIDILVYHSTTKLWRHVDFKHFLADPLAPSWDLTAHPTYDDLEAALSADPS